MFVQDFTVADADEPRHSTFAEPAAANESDGRLRAAEKSRARYQLLADNMADVVTRVRLDGASNYISPAIENLIGYTPLQMHGRLSHDFVWPADRKILQRAFAEMAGGLEAKKVRHRVEHRDGHPVWVETRLRLLRDADGKPIEIVAVIRDIEEQVAAETALAESEARHRLIAEVARDVISRVNMQGEVLYISPSVTNVAGYAPDQIIGSSMIPLVHKDDRYHFLRAYRELAVGGRQGGQPIRYRICHADKHWVWIEGNPSLVRDENGQPAGYVDVSRDVTEQVRMEAELTAARDAANAASQAKSEFLANMSHELRTPLTVVIGFAGLLNARRELDPRSRHMIERIDNASRSLLATINDVLDISRMDAGGIPIAPVPTDVRGLAQEAAELFSAQAAAKGLSLESHAGERIPASLTLDPVRVRQLLVNLVGNAVKFTARGAVTLSLDWIDDRLLVEVSDTGPGLNEEEIGRIFERFTQLDSSDTRAHGGAGLGLAVCKGLITAMGGEIGVRSTPGVGSTFWFSIPDMPASRPATV